MNYKTPCAQAKSKRCLKHRFKDLGKLEYTVYFKNSSSECFGLFWWDSLTKPPTLFRLFSDMSKVLSGAEHIDPENGRTTTSKFGGHELK